MILPLTISELSGKKVNLHTHTKRCKHAVGEDKEYVEKAIEAVRMVKANGGNVICNI